MVSKNKLLKNADIVYYSPYFDLYFLRKITYYYRKETRCNRVQYYTMSKGKHRKKEGKAVRYKKAGFDEKLKMCKMFDTK